jgi:hypothetical protein
MTYGSAGDLYWVATGFIDSLRYTNFYPYLKNPVPDQDAVKGELFTYSIPDSTFFDDDGNNTLTFQALIANGTPLPGWLSFDSITGTFSGIPDSIQTLIIKVSATDTAGASASTNFRIFVGPPTAIDLRNNPGANVRIFPNPTAGILNVSTDRSAGETATVDVRNLVGEVLQKSAFVSNITLDLSGMPKGLYILRLQIGDEIIIRKVCVN